MFKAFHEMSNAAWVLVVYQSFFNIELPFPLAANSEHNFNKQNFFKKFMLRVTIRVKSVQHSPYNMVFPYGRIEVLSGDYSSGFNVFLILAFPISAFFV